jgi:TatD DNase family protein
MFIDTHAHLYHEQFDEDRHEMIERALESGIAAILMPAIDVASIRSAIALSEQYDELYAMAGLHPSATEEAGDAEFQTVRELCDHPQVIAVGESGLDYYWDQSFVDRQQEFYRRHIRLAIERDLPLVLHNREASEDLVEILREEIEASPEGQQLRGVFHCFVGPQWIAEAAMESGFYLGLGGILTFGNSDVAVALEGVPDDRLLLETDAPFLAPEPKRGRRNESSFLPHIAGKLAEVRGLSVEETAEITSHNARELFGDIA